MTTTLIACTAAVSDDYFLATLFGITAMNVAAEQAASALDMGEGLGTFKVKLFDAVSNLKGLAVAEGFRGDKL
jgi:hydroxyethylthiazole kinase